MATQKNRKRSKRVTSAPTERGQRTQRALMDAALDLMAKGRSFNSLSMREVTMKAGVVPTAFYRHYKDMNELAMAVVDDCGRALRPLLRQARFEGASSKDIIRASMLTYRKFVEKQPRYFMVASGERHGGSPVVRAAIQHEIQLFVDEMVEDLQQLQLLPNLSPASTRTICDLVVNTMLSAASEILDWQKKGRAYEQQRMDNYVQQLRIIFFGAAQWCDQPPTGKKSQPA